MASASAATRVRPTTLRSAFLIRLFSWSRTVRCGFLRLGESAADIGYGNHARGAKLVEAVFEGSDVADQNDDVVRRVEVLPRGGQHVIGGDRADPLWKLGPIFRRKMIEHRLQHLVGHLAGGLKLQRLMPHQVITAVLDFRRLAGVVAQGGDFIRTISVALTVSAERVDVLATHPPRME